MNTIADDMAALSGSGANEMILAFTAAYFAICAGILCLHAQKARRDTLSLRSIGDGIASTIVELQADYERLVEILRASWLRAKAAEAEREAAIRARDFAIGQQRDMAAGFDDLLADIRTQRRLLDLTAGALEDFGDNPDARMAVLADIREGVASPRLTDTPTTR